jgi:hypothetical protein
MGVNRSTTNIKNQVALMKSVKPKGFGQKIMTRVEQKISTLVATLIRL